MSCIGSFGSYYIRTDSPEYSHHEKIVIPFDFGVSEEKNDKVKDV